MTRSSICQEYQCGERPILDWLLEEALEAVKKNIREITSIDLSSVTLSHEYIKELTEALSTNNQLKILKLSNTKMTDSSLKVNLVLSLIPEQHCLRFLTLFLYSVLPTL